MADLADGLSDKMIADKRGITENAVGNHRGRIYLKLGVRNAVQAVARYYRLKTR